MQLAGAPLSTCGAFIIETCNSPASIYTQAKEAYAAMVDCVRRAYMPERVHDGRFAAMMDVALVNDGPVTITIDSQAR